MSLVNDVAVYKVLKRTVCINSCLLHTNINIGIKLYFLTHHELCHMVESEANVNFVLHKFLLSFRIEDLFSFGSMMEDKVQCEHIILKSGNLWRTFALIPDNLVSNISSQMIFIAICLGYKCL